MHRMLSSGLTSSLVALLLLSWRILSIQGLVLQRSEGHEQGRRTVLQSLLVGSSSVFLSPSGAIADETPSDLKTYQSDLFALSVPSSWSVITNTADNNTNKQPLRKDGLLFSALDLSSGSVVTVYREQACDLATYVQDSKNYCDLMLPKDGGPLFGEATLQKDLQKLLIRYDERDNKVLDGTTALVEYSATETRNKNNCSLRLMGATVIPTGGTYRDGMGLDQPKTLTRIVKASVLVLSEENTVLSAWISAPEDEWQKPVSGIRLRSAVESLRLIPSSSL
jgi:hypothetical protein